MGGPGSGGHANCGPKPMPRELLLLRGNAGHRAIDKLPPEDIDKKPLGVCPYGANTFLAKTWRAMAEAGHWLRSSDAEVVENYCLAKERLRDAHRLHGIACRRLARMTKQGIGPEFAEVGAAAKMAERMVRTYEEHVRKNLLELGFTPAMRLRIAKMGIEMAGKQKDENGEEDIFATG